MLEFEWIIVCHVGCGGLVIDKKKMLQYTELAYRLRREQYYIAFPTPDAHTHAKFRRDKPQRTSNGVTKQFSN